MNLTVFPILFVVFGTMSHFRRRNLRFRESGFFFLWIIIRRKQGSGIFGVLTYPSVGASEFAATVAGNFTPPFFGGEAPTGELGGFRVISKHIFEY